MLKNFYPLQRKISIANDPKTNYCSGCILIWLEIILVNFGVFCLGWSFCTCSIQIVPLNVVKFINYLCYLTNLPSSLVMCLRFVGSHSSVLCINKDVFSNMYLKSKIKKNFALSSFIENFRLIRNIWAAMCECECVYVCVGYTWIHILRPTGLVL